MDEIKNNANETECPNETLEEKEINAPTNEAKPEAEKEISSSEEAKSDEEKKAEESFGEGMDEGELERLRKLASIKNASASSSDTQTGIAELVVKATNLTKSYGSFCALNGINLGLKKGKIIGLLGPNGSGKTTFIKILAGLLTPTSGEVTICSHHPGTETKALVSYLPERPYFNTWMRVSQCLDYFQDFYADFDRARAEAMLKDLSVPLNAKLKTLSKGTKEKVQLILVMARRARLYLLDEPIAGVDPAAREYILKTIVSNYQSDATVVISTHLISDVESVLDSYIFIDKGCIVESRDVKPLANEKGDGAVDARFREVFRYV